MAAKARFGVANGYSGEPLPVMSLPAFETAIVHGCANTHGAARVHRSRKFEAICGVLVRSEGGDKLPNLFGRRASSNTVRAFGARELAAVSLPGTLGGLGAVGWWKISWLAQVLALK